MDHNNSEGRCSNNDVRERLNTGAERARRTTL